VTVERFPIAFQQIYHLSKYFFTDAKIPLSIIVSKTPYISAAIAAYGAKSILGEYLKPGTCFLIPKTGDCTQLSHAVIESTELQNEQLFYFYKLKKQRVSNKKIQLELNDVGIVGKPASYIKSKAIVYPYASDNEWLGRHDIDQSELLNKNNFTSIYPLIIGNKTKFNKWLNVDLGLIPNKKQSISEISGIKTGHGKYEELKFIAPINGGRVESPTIWINKIPPSTFNGRGIVIISPHLSNFEDKILQLGDLFQEQKLIPSTLCDIPSYLGSLLSEMACYKISLLKKDLQ
jgi:hypothetical protein